MKVLVVVDNEAQIKDFQHKNEMFVRAMDRKTRTEMSGPKDTFYFVFHNAMEAGTCGRSVDAVINLSSGNRKVIRDSSLPCIANREWRLEDEKKKLLESSGCSSCNPTSR